MPLPACVCEPRAWLDESSSCDCDDFPAAPGPRLMRHQSPASRHLVTRTVTAERSAWPRRWLQEAVAAPGPGRPRLLPLPWVPIEPLSRSEMRVLRYLPTNLSALDIARELSVSVTTVRTHISHLFVKLGAHRI
ncbi:MAG: helix-turn-helix transcriptional regulator [Trebonia sp.]